MARKTKPLAPQAPQMSRAEWELAFERKVDELRPNMESCLPGVFAVGDVRSGSVKRVGGAIGEGAAVVAQIHRYTEAAVARR